MAKLNQGPILHHADDKQRLGLNPKASTFLGLTENIDMLKDTRKTIGVDTTLSGSLSFNFEDVVSGAAERKLARKDPEDYALTYTWTLREWTASNLETGFRFETVTKTEVHSIRNPQNQEVIDEKLLLKTNPVTGVLENAHTPATGTYTGIRPTLAPKVNADAKDQLFDHLGQPLPGKSTKNVDHSNDHSHVRPLPFDHPTNAQALHGAHVDYGDDKQDRHVPCGTIAGETCYLKYTYTRKLPVQPDPKVPDPVHDPAKLKDVTAVTVPDCTGTFVHPVTKKLLTTPDPCKEKYDSIAPQYIHLSEGPQFWGRLSKSLEFEERDTIGYDGNSTLKFQDAALFRGVKYNRKAQTGGTRWDGKSKDTTGVLSDSIQCSNQQTTNDCDGDGVNAARCLAGILPELPGALKNSADDEIQTAGFANRKLTKTRSQRTTTTTTAQLVADPLPFCSIYLYNFQSMEAYFEMYPSWKQCQGHLTFSLTVDDGCTSSTDTVEIDVKCNKPPIAVACCDTTVAWQSTTVGQQGFPPVVLDGRVRKAHELDRQTPPCPEFWGGLDQAGLDQNACIDTPVKCPTGEKDPRTGRCTPDPKTNKCAAGSKLDATTVPPTCVPNLPRTTLDTDFYDDWTTAAHQQAAQDVLKYARKTSDPLFKLELEKDGHNHYWADTKAMRIASAYPLVGDFQKAKAAGFCKLDPKGDCTAAEVKKWAEEAPDSEAAPILFKWTAKDKEGKDTGPIWVQDPSAGPPKLYTPGTTPSPKLEAQKMDFWQKNAYLPIQIQYPGQYTLTLTVNDGCNEAEDHVIVTAHCIELNPEIVLVEAPKADKLVAQASGSLSNAPHYTVVTTGVGTNSGKGTKLIFGLANTPLLYGPRGELSELFIKWKLEPYDALVGQDPLAKVPDGTLLQPNFPKVPDEVRCKIQRCGTGAQNCCDGPTCCIRSDHVTQFGNNFQFTRQGDYKLTVEVRDECWKRSPTQWRTATKIIRVLCSQPGQQSSEWSLATLNPFSSNGNWIENPIVTTTHPSRFVFNFNYAAKVGQPVAAAYETIRVRLPRNLIPDAQKTGLLRYRFQVFEQSNMNKPLANDCPNNGKVPSSYYDPITKTYKFCQTFHSDQVANAPDFDFTPARFGQYIVRVFLSDDCKTEVYDSQTPITAQCGSTPVPRIERGDTSVTGVSFDNFEYRVRYDNRAAGFYSLVLQCEGRVQAAKAFEECKWKFPGQGQFYPTLKTLANGGARITPLRASGTSAGGFTSGRVVDVITLTIEDGCQRNTENIFANATIRAVCSRPALQLKPGVQRSFAPKWLARAKGFAEVFLKGQVSLGPGSALKQNDFLSYQWCLVSPKSTNSLTCAENKNAALGVIKPAAASSPHNGYTKNNPIYDGCNGGQCQVPVQKDNPVTFKPPTPTVQTDKVTSTYSVRLTVSDGCQESDAFIFTITCTCIDLSVNIVAKGADGFRIVRWDSAKNRFPDVEVHSDLKYGGNYAELQYTWKMLTSPGHDLICNPNTKVVMSQWGATQTKMCKIERPSIAAANDVVTHVFFDDKGKELTTAQSGQRYDQRYKKTTKQSRSYNINETTTVSSELTSLGSRNKLAEYKNDWMVFTPDLKGQYQIELSVNDGCQEKKMNISLYAACNDSPNPVLKQEVMFVSLDGQTTTFPFGTTNQSRVVVDASQSRDPNDDPLTYHWTLFYSGRTSGDGRTPRTYEVVARTTDKQDTDKGLANRHGIGMGPSATDLYQANWDGPIFSFVPDRQGSYIAQVDVHDGCSSVKVNASINVNCQRSTIASTARVDMYEKYYTYKTDLSPRFGAPFYLNAFLSDECAQRFVEKKERVAWEFIRHECIDPEVKEAPPTNAPVQTCNKKLAFDWTLEEKPCPSKLSTVSIEDRKSQKAILHPDVAGTYKMRLTVKDLCSVDNSTVVTVEAKCTTRLTVQASAANKRVSNDCSSNDLKFDAVQLTGTVKDGPAGRGSDWYPPHDDICRAPPTTAPPTPSPTFSPAGCCPTCSQCPACAQCPGCTQDCNCGNTRGWQYECQPVTRAKTVLRRVSTLMEHRCSEGAGCATTEVGTDYCPESCVQNPSCSCVWQAVMKNQTVDVEEASCDWVRVPIQGVFNSYASKKHTYSRPTFKRMSMASKRAARAESPVSAAFIAVMSTICVMLIASVVVNVMYWRKIRALGDSMETSSVNISNLSSDSSEST
jgi:hypothetical protein